MDIEGPESPIRSLRDFAVHIATVTIGILIALGLEALIEAHRHHDLAEHARADFRTEFTDNRNAALNDIRRSHAVEAELAGLISYGRAKLANQPAVFPKLQSERSFLHLPTTAWDTATATQALLYLPFGEAKLISRAQSNQVALNDLESRAETQWFELAAYGDPQHLQRSDVEPALQKVTIAYAYVVSLKNAEIGLVSSYDHALRALGPP